MARGLAVAVVAVLALSLAPRAYAVDVPLTADCDTLDNAFATIQANTDADINYVVTQNSSSGGLDGLCHRAFTGPDLATPGPAESYRTWTLKGSDGMNDGFSGDGVIGRVLTVHDPHRVLLQDLTF